MVLWIVKWFTNKNKVTEFQKFGQEEGTPHWLSTPGVKRVRALTNEHTREVLWMAEFESYEAWGKAMDQPKTKEIMQKFRSLTHNVTWDLWTPSEQYPEGRTP